MKRRLLGLAVLGIALSSCGVGVRQPATDITATSATLNGKAVSTVGGPGNSFFTYGPAVGFMRSTPVRNIDFGRDSSVPVSVPVDGLEPGTTYRYRVCAGDGDNPGGLCSPIQAFTTAGTGVRAFRPEAVCSNPDDFSQEAVVLNFEPNTAYGLRFQFVEGASGTGGAPFTTDDAGNAGIGSVGLSEPFRVRVTIWLDPDSDFVQDPGEETVLDDVYAADEPCTDAQPEEPASS